MKASEVSTELAIRIESLVHILAAGRSVHKFKGQLRVGNRGSLAIELRHPHPGVWCDHESGEGGDALDLVCHLRGGDVKDALDWSRDWLQVPQAPPPPANHHRRNDAEIWRAIWGESEPIIRTPGETYLLSRGLTPQPGAPLRFHPRCPCRADRLPAMVALMTDPITNVPIGVHRTFLKPDGSAKANVTPAKMMIGSAGVIRLTPDEEVTAGLGICEGIENGLAILQHVGWTPIWAAGSAGGIARFPDMHGIEAITIFADADDKGAGLNAADECTTRWRLGGKKALIHVPPSGTDWLDALAVNK